MAGKGEVGELTERWFKVNRCDVTSAQAPKIVPEVTDYNRQTTIAFLKFFSKETR
jgi:hypothetical protein